MIQLRKLIRKSILNNYITNLDENLEYVEKYTGNSDAIKQGAENWAEEINAKGNRVSFNFTNDSLDFKKTSYMLEILMYAIAKQENGSFTLPATNKTISVNPSKISDGIKTFLFPSFSLKKFAAFITGGNFSITAEELNQLDVYDAIGKIANVLETMPVKIQKYVSGYNESPRSSFINYLQTAIRFALRDLRKLHDKRKTSSLDDTFGDGGKSRGDMIAGEETDSYNDFNLSNVADDEATYEPEIGVEITRILELNNDIYKLIEKSASAASKEVFSKYFYYKIIGEGGNEKVFGKTLNHAGIIQKYLNGDLPNELGKDIAKKIQSSAPKFFAAKPEMLAKFKSEHPESFTKEDKILVTKELIKFMSIYAKGNVPNIKDGKPELNDKGQIKLIPTGPIAIQKRIAKDIKNLFLKNSVRLKELNELVKNSGIIDPKTNNPFDGASYLSRLFKVGPAKQDIEAGVQIPTTTPVGELSEALYEGNLLEEGEESDDQFSFNDILSIAKATAKIKKNIKLQEAKKIIRNILIKNIIK